MRTEKDVEAYLLRLNRRFRTVDEQPGTFLVEAAAEAGYREAHPVDNTSGTIVQRKNTVRVFIRRALRELAPV